MIVKKIVIRSNGDAVLHYEDGDTHIVRMLDSLVEEMLASTEKIVDETTMIHIPLCSEPIPFTKWFELKPAE